MKRNGINGNRNFDFQMVAAVADMPPQSEKSIRIQIWERRKKDTRSHADSRRRETRWRMFN